MTPLLRLKAVDGDDLRAMSALVQDSLVLVGDISFDATQRQVLVALSRYIWENGEKRERTVSILTIDEVDAVKYRAIDRAKPDVILSLLSLTRTDKGIELIFSGVATVLIVATSLAIYLTDVGESWPTLWRPTHD